ncbi:LolA family protein [Actinoplanes subglobosus]|uniref:Outer membrane lipoprotein carrier protein LolA n=1 Tax=Actinoplanes subglobosus TaxID=1547892 RepID=A0ABV8IH10_9ACTN
MSVLRSRPALRWLVPSVAAVAVIGGGAAAGTIVANADPALPERSAAQLLVDLQSADPSGFSGTVVQSADLGLPGIAGLLGNATGGSGNLTSLIAGSNTARLWYAGEEKMRFSLLGTSSETDVIRNGSDVWIWDSKENTGTHVKLPAGAGTEEAAPASSLTPQQAADAALAAIDGSTEVETTGAAEVAGRDAYELVISPRDTDSLVGQVRLAIDAKEHIPLRVDVYAKNTTKPAIRVAFDQINFTVPDDQQFAFNPPAGAKITEQAIPADAAKDAGKEAHKAAAEAEKAAREAGADKSDFKVVGEGWTAVAVAKGPSLDELGEITGKQGDEQSAEGAEASQLAQGLLDTLKPVSGAWGSGKLLEGSLFSVLMTDDGRVLAGAVTPEALYKVAAAK